MIMYAAAMGKTITAVFQCLSAISVNGFLTLINDNLNMYINDHLRMYTSDYALI